MEQQIKPTIILVENEGNLVKRAVRALRLVNTVLITMILYKNLTKDIDMKKYFTINFTKKNDKQE